ncbi:hypothetical protein BH09PSE3_BH09PSE3_16020 [soil metagenome]
MSLTPSEKFLLIVFNRSERSFTVEDPVCDDEAWSVAVQNTRLSGHDVGYETYLDGPERFWPRRAAQEFRNRTGYHRVAKGSIVHL